jgi:putative hydrolase of the HAD superfamily
VDDFVAVWLEAENAPDERIIQVIRVLRKSGLVCGLATSQERYRADYMATVMGFSGLFDRLFFSCDLGNQKPELQYYVAVEQSLGLEAREILFWDDSAANVEAARARGWNAETYTDFDSFSTSLAGYLGTNSV